MFERKQISEGVFFNCISDLRFKVNMISIKFLLPLEKENNAPRALIFPVIIGGTENYPTEKDLNRYLEEIYCSTVSSSFNRLGNICIQNLNAVFLRKKYIQDETDVETGVLKVLEDMLRHPVLEGRAFKKEKVETEKMHLADSERSVINNKGKYAVNRCMEQMLSDDDFGYPPNGTVEDIERTTPEQIYEQYLYMLEHARIEVFAAGELDFGKYCAFVKELFSGVDRKYEDNLSVSPITDHVREVKRINETDDVAQGKMVIGFRTFCSSVDDYSKTAPLIVGMNLFGAGSTSKLFNNVREKMSLCYYCSSFSVMDKGLMLIQSGVAKENEKKAFDAIMEQFENVKKGDISDGEIENAKSDAISDLVGAFDYLRGVISWYFVKTITGKSYDKELLVNYFKGVTKEQIVESFKSIELDTYYFLCGGESNE